MILVNHLSLIHDIQLLTTCKRRVFKSYFSPCNKAFFDTLEARTGPISMATAFEANNPPINTPKVLKEAFQMK